MENITENIYKTKLIENTKKIYDMIDMIKNRKSNETKYYTLTTEELHKLALSKIQKIDTNNNNNSSIDFLKVFGIILIFLVSIYLYYNYEKNINKKPEDIIDCNNGYCFKVV